MDSGNPSEDTIEFVDPARDRSQLRCPICGDEVGKAPTNCPFCNTPHHFDCWEYAGGCGVYGCSAKPRTPGATAPENTIDLPAKLGLPHKRTGSYAGVWWVPPIAGVLSIVCEVMAIGSMAAGSGGAAALWLSGMLACLVWIAFSSVHYYVDFEKMRISQAKSFLGRDLIEWGVEDLKRISHLEVQKVPSPLEYLQGTDPAGPSSPATGTTQFRVLAVYQQQGLFSRGPIEICPPLLLGEESMREVADLFRRIEASHAFPVKMHRAVKALPPPAENRLLLEAKKS